MLRSRIYTVIAAATATLIITQVLLEVYLEDDKQWPVSVSPHLIEDDFHNHLEDVAKPVVLWWEPIDGSPYPRGFRQCGQLSCYFTDDRQFHNHPQTKVLVFYGTSLNLTDMPVPRRSESVLWALLHEESPRNNPALSHLPLLSLFNITATFSRNSSFPLTTQYLEDLKVLTDVKYFLSTDEKNRLQREEGLAPVMYLQTDCSTPIDRDTYVQELAQHIQIDSYGACLHNKELPIHLQPPHNLDTMMADELLHLVAKYKFMLAIENGVCQDYITEKLWRPLITGTVPIYIGSPTVSDWLPNVESAVLGLNFDSPAALANHLHLLNGNDSAYNSCLKHKLEGQVSNRLLVQTLEQRSWDIEMSSDRPDYLRDYECFICQRAHEPKQVSVATKDHYHCPMPRSLLTQVPNISNFWLDNWFYGACEAQALRQLVDSGVIFTHQEYDKALEALMFDRKCQYTVENARAMYSEQEFGIN